MGRRLVGAAGMFALLWTGAIALGSEAEAPPGNTIVQRTAAKEAADSKTAQKPLPLRHGVFRFESYPAAWTAAQETNRPILVYACSPSCPNCVRMLSETYKSQGVSQFVSDSFETVLVDSYEQPAMVQKLHLRWFPTTIVVSPNNQVIDVIEGFVDPATFQRRLQTTLASQNAKTQTR